MFSAKTREAALDRFRHEPFDILIVGGGITGAATARDAAMRGLKVALVEKGDFASGTSSRSSKLIHGGLRYLETLEFGLVFEALSERATLLKSLPNLVSPIEFYFPIYQGATKGMTLLSLGMWLYDALSLFRSPGRHQRLSSARLCERIPNLSADGLQGGFHYYDAAMWDDAIVIQLLRSAAKHGAAVANYVRAVEPIHDGAKTVGFVIQDLESTSAPFHLHARQVILCGGPYTDLLGATLTPQWKSWLNPSKGIHILFDLKRLPLPGAVVMTHPSDGRISFAIPRPDFGAGVVIVGTTDGPTPANPDEASVEAADVDYLLSLLNRHFPALNLSTRDIVSAYVGVRPLVAGTGPASLHKVSREHFIDITPCGTVVVAGGKYTTHRTMASQIVDRALAAWGPNRPALLKPARTDEAPNPGMLPFAIEAAAAAAQRTGRTLPKELLFRYGADAVVISERASTLSDPDGFPFLDGQLRHAMAQEMVMHLEDFYFRRIPLFASRSDSGLPWLESLATVWANQRGASADQRQQEIQRTRNAIARQRNWIHHGQGNDPGAIGSCAQPPA